LFIGTTLGKGKYDFESADFAERVIFDRLINAGAVKAFSCKFATFDKSFQLSADEPFHCVVDLTGTKTTHHVSLAGLTCHLKTKRPLKLIRSIARLPGGRPLRRYAWVPLSQYLRQRTMALRWLNKTRACDPQDADRFRRLKEIAENNKDLAQALEFKAQEIQAGRWHNTTTRWDRAMEFLFEKLSNYGRSERLPLLWLIVFWLAFAGLYTGLSNTVCRMCIEDKISSALIFSAGQMLPFVPSAREARLSWENVLFLGDRLPGFIYALTFIQSIVAVGLLFLLGLALRNRFKL
jgi:hypothetical protein